MNISSLLNVGTLFTESSAFNLTALPNESLVSALKSTWSSTRLAGFDPTQSMRRCVRALSMANENPDRVAIALCGAFDVESTDNCTVDGFRNISISCSEAYDRADSACTKETLDLVLSPDNSDECEQLFRFSESELHCLDKLLEAVWDCILIPAFNSTFDFPSNVTLFEFNECNSTLPSVEPLLEPSAAPSTDYIPTLQPTELIRGSSVPTLPLDVSTSSQFTQMNGFAIVMMLMVGLANIN